VVDEIKMQEQLIRGLSALKQRKLQPSTQKIVEKVAQATGKTPTDVVEESIHEHAKNAYGIEDAMVVHTRSGTKVLTGKEKLDETTKKLSTDDLEDRLNRNTYMRLLNMQIKQMEKDLADGKDISFNPQKMIEQMYMIKMLDSMIPKNEATQAKKEDNGKEDKLMQELAELKKQLEEQKHEAKMNELRAELKMLSEKLALANTQKGPDPIVTQLLNSRTEQDKELREVSEKMNEVRTRLLEEKLGQHLENVQRQIQQLQQGDNRSDITKLASEIATIKQISDTLGFNRSNTDNKGLVQQILQNTTDMISNAISSTQRQPAQLAPPPPAPGQEPTQAEPPTQPTQQQAQLPTAVPNYISRVEKAIQDAR